jgi:chromosome segregation ATPase
MADKYRVGLEIEADAQGVDKALSDVGKGLQDLAGYSEEAAEKAGPLVQEMEALEKATRAQEGLKQASANVEELARQLEQAERAVGSAAKGLEDAERRAEGARAGYADAAAAVKELTEQQQQLQQAVADANQEKAEGQRELKALAESIREAKEQQKEYAREIKDTGSEEARKAYEETSESIKEMAARQKELREEIAQASDKKREAADDLKEITGALKDAAREQEQYSKGLKDAEGNLDNAADLLERKKKAVEETAEAQRAAGEELDRWQNRAQAAGLDTENLTRNSVNLKDRMGELENQSAALADEVKKAGEELKQAGEESEKAGGKLGTMQDSIITLVAAAGGIAAITSALKSSALEADQYFQRQARLEAQLDATGNAAGISAERIRELSHELALATLGSVEEFEKASSQLLKFTSITGDTFERTLRVSKDLAEVIGGDAAGAAQKLGRALEDPRKGMEQLSRAGVTFTNDQQQVINRLIETGQVAEAQALILEAVEGRVGGVAEAMAQGLGGAVDTLNQRLEDLRLASGQAIEPELTAIVNALAGAVEALGNNTDIAVNALKGIAAVGLVALIPKITAAVVLATAATTALGAAMRALPLVAVAGGLTALAKPAAELAASFSDAAREMDKFAEGRAEQLREQIAALEETIDTEKDALNFRIAATAQLLEGGERVIAQQQRQVEWAKEQLDVQFSIALRERELAELRGESTKEQEAQIAILRKAIDELRKDSERLNEAQAIVADGFQAVGNNAVRAGEQAEVTAEAYRALVKEMEFLDEIGSDGDFGRASMESLQKLGQAAEEGFKRASEEVAALETALAQMGDASEEVRAAFERDLAAATARLEEMGAAADKVRVEALARLGLDAEELATGLSKSFRDAAAAVELVGNSANASEVEIRAALDAMIAVAESEQEIKAVAEAVAQIGESGKLSAEALEEVGGALADIEFTASDAGKALEALGLDAKEVATGLSQGFRDAEAAVRLLGDSGNATKEQLAAAIGVLKDTAESQQELAAVIKLVKDLEQQGKLTTTAMMELVAEIEGMADATSEVEAAFKRLGVTSRAELQRIAQQAQKDYEIIRRSGTASTQDIAKALDALAARADASGDRQIKAFVAAERAALGLKEEIEEVAASSGRAGDAMEEAGYQGEQAFDRAAAAAERLADANARASDAAAGPSGRQPVQGVGIPPGAQQQFDRLVAKFGQDFAREFERRAATELTGRFGSPAAAAVAARGIMDSIASQMGAAANSEGGTTAAPAARGGLGQPVSQTININVTGVATADPKAMEQLARQIAPAVAKLNRLGA